MIISLAKLLLLVIFMIESNKKIFDILISDHKEGKDIGKVYIFQGDQGLGQQDVFGKYRKYIESSSNSYVFINIRPAFQSYSLFSIWSSLNKYIDLDFIATENYNINQGLDYDEYLISKIITLGKEKTVLFFCDSMAKCDKTIKDFIIRITTCVFPYVASTMICFYFTDDINPDYNTTHHDMIKYFAMLGNRTKYLFFSHWSDESLIKYLYNYFNQNIEITKLDLNAIISSSFGNPTQLLNIVEYLKSEGIIFETKDGYVCSSFDENFLLYKAEQFVLNKYHMLDKKMKDLIRSSSIIGYEFDKKLLVNPLNFLISDQHLKIIEKLTQLIHAKIDDIFTFHDQTSYLSIKNIVEPEEYLQWNITLGDYFFKQSNNYQNNLNDMEVIDSLLKSGFYYYASDLKKKALLIYLRVLPMLVSIMNYSKAIEIIQIIRCIYAEDKSNISSSDYNRLFLFEGDCHYNLFNYIKAAESYNQYVRFPELTPLESYEAQCQYSLAIYNAGKTQESYNLLLSILNHLKDEETERSAHILVRVLSYMSSIEETLYNGQHIAHYNQALALSKEYNITEEYNQLLRKALIVHKGKNGIALMSAALDYYKQTNNLKEYAMCLHNIATEMLYHDDIDAAKEYLEESILIFNSFGSEGVHYSINALGDYWCLKGKFKKALFFYQKAYSNRIELFSKIGILINQATAYRCLRYYNKAKASLDSVEKLMKEKDAVNYSIINQHFFLNSALTEMSMQHYLEAYQFFLTYFNKESNYESHRMVIASNNFKKVCDKISMDFPQEFAKFLKYNSHTIQRLSPNNLVLVRFSFAE